MAKELGVRQANFLSFRSEKLVSILPVDARKQYMLFFENK